MVERNPEIIKRIEQRRLDRLQKGAEIAQRPVVDSIAARREITDRVALSHRRASIIHRDRSQKK